jgi:streptogramin lyase
MKRIRILLITLSLIVCTGALAWAASGCLYRLPAAGAFPNGISFDGINGYVWFTEQARLAIGFVDVSGPICSPTQITEFPLPPGIGRPVDIGVDLSSGGSQVWFSTDQGRMGMLDTSIPAFTIYTLPGNPTLDQINIDLVNNLVWFAEVSTNKIGNIPLGGGLPVTEYLITPGVSNIAGITTDANGIVWFTTRTGGLIGRFDMITVTLWPSTLRSLETITADPNGIAVWATTGIGVPTQDYQIIKLDYTASNLTLYNTANPGSHPYGIRVRLSDGLVTVGEEGQSKLGLIDPSVAGASCMRVVGVQPTRATFQRRLLDDLRVFNADPIVTPVSPSNLDSNGIPCGAPFFPAVTEYPITPTTPGPRLLDLDPTDQPWFALPAANAIGFLAVP